MSHLLIRFCFPNPRSYPKARHLPWLKEHAMIDPQEVIRLKTWLTVWPWPNKHGKKAEVIGKASRELMRLAHIAMKFLEHAAVKADMVIGNGLEPRFERFPRPKIVLGSASLLQALHEIAHARFGPSEAVAAAWSCRMMEELFPEIRVNGKWFGHILVNEDEFIAF